MIISFDTAEEQLISQIKGLLVNESFEVIEHNQESVIMSNHIKLYSKEQRVEIGNKSMILGRRQFALLLLLVRNSNRIFTKDEIYSFIWNDAIPINVEETIRYHISDIRKKLNNLAGQTFIETVWGIGYRFRDTL